MQVKTTPLIFGKISGIYGIKGWLKVASYTRPPENLFSYQPWYLALENDWYETKLENYSKQGKFYLVKLVDIDNREQANKFIRADIGIYPDQLPSLDDGQHYWHELIGLQVKNLDDVELGRITDIWDTAANDVLVVEGEKRYLIPYIKDIYIKDIEIDKDLLRVDWQTGEVS